MERVTLNTFLATFSENTQHPSTFLGIPEGLSDGFKSNIKDLYDFTKNEETKKNSIPSGKSLKKLIIQDFDFEQIWQQIELQNDDVMDASVKNLSTLLVAKNNLIFKSLNDEVSNEIANTGKPEIIVDMNSCTDNSSSNSDSDEHIDERDLEIVPKHRQNEESDEEALTSRKPAKQKQKGSVVDDEFFKLNEMENFLEKQEKSETSKDTQSASDEEDEEGSVNLFEEESEESEDEAKTARFKDYFVSNEEDKPKQKTNRLLQELEGEEGSESGSDNENVRNEMKSTLELRQERLKRKIENLEEQAISDKPWQLKGEITAESRPQNSLLEEIMEFDLTSRPAPIITEQTSLQLEDIIRQRIKHKIFDSVDKKIRPIETPLEYKKKLVLDQEKSKESLAKIYEKEYLEQQASLDKEKMDTDEPEPELHKEVKKLMKSLFTKLDALSNFYFTSTPAIPELKIISNLPAINMEEVAPVASSEAALLAPEEIRNKLKGDIIGKQEKTSTDRKRERRKKKLKQKIHSKRKAKIENKISKKQRDKT